MKDLDGNDLQVGSEIVMAYTRTDYRVFKIVSMTKTRAKVVNGHDEKTLSLFTGDFLGTHVEASLIRNMTRKEYEDFLAELRNREEESALISEARSILAKISRDLDMGAAKRIIANPGLYND